MASSRYDVGTAYVTIRARYEEAVKDAAQGGSLFGQKFGKAAGDTAQKEFDKSFSPGGGKTKSEKAGAEDGDAFARAYKAAINGALKYLPAKVNIEPGKTPELDAKIEAIRAELEEISHTKITPEFDADKAFARALQLQQLLRELGLETPHIRPEMDIGLAAASIGGLVAVYQGARKEIEKAVTVEVKINDGAFLTKAKAAAAAAKEALGDLYLNPNIDDAKIAAKVVEIKALLSSIENFKVGIDGNDDDLLAKVAEVRAILQDIAHNSPDVRLSADAAKGDAVLDIFEAKVDKLDHKKVTVKVDADTAAANAELKSTEENADSASGAAGRVSGGVNGLAAVLIGLGPALIPVAAAAAAAIAGMLAPIIAVVGAVGVLALAFHGVFAAVSAMNTASAKNSATQQAQAQQAAAAQDAVKQAIQGVKDAEQSLADARRAAAQDASDDAKSVANALESQKRAEYDAAQATLKALQAVKDAERGVADARRQASRDAIDSAEAVKNAQQGVSDTITQNSQNIQSALDEQTQSQQALTKAEEDARKSEEALSQARIQSTRDMQNLTNAIIDGRNALAGDKANVQTLTLQYQQELLNPLGDAQSKAAALLALQEGQQKVVEQQQANANNRQDLGHDKAQGGTDQLLNAQQAQADSYQAVADAQANVAKANDNLTQTELANVQALKASEQQLADARRAQARQEADDQRSIKDAERAVAQVEAAQIQQRIQNERALEDAQKAVENARESQSRDAVRDAEAIQKAEEGVQRAQEAVTKAEAAQGAAAAKSATAVATAMDKLTPAGKQFAKFLYSLKGDFTGLSAAAQNGLLPGVEQGIKDLLPLLPSLTKFVGALGKEMGSIFEAGAKLAGGPAGKGFLSFLTATSPGVLKEYSDILGNFALGLVKLLPVLQPFAKMLADALLGLSNQFLNFSKTAGKNKAFSDLASYMRKAFHEIGGLITDLFKALANVLPALAPLGDQMIGFIDKVLKYLSTANPKTIRFLAEGFLILFGLFTIGGPVFNAVKGLKLLGGAILALFDAAGGLSFLITGLGVAFIYAYTHSEKFRNQINGAVKSLEPFGKALLGDVKKGMDYLGSKSVQYAPKVFDFIAKAVKAVVGVVKSMVPGFKEAGKVVEDIVGVMIIFYGHIAKEITPAIDRLIESMSGPRQARKLQDFKDFLGFAAKAVERLLGIMKIFAPYLGDIVGGVLEAIIDIFGTMANVVGDVGNLMDDLLHLRFGQFVKDLGALFKDIFNGVKNVLKDLGAPFLKIIKTVGENLIHGLVKGVEGAGKYLWDHFKKFLDHTLIGNILDYFGIHSPSKLFSDIGVNLIKGLVNGILGLADFLWSRVSGFFDDFIGKITGYFGIAAGAALTFVKFGEAMIQGVVNAFGSVGIDIWNALKTVFIDLVSFVGGFFGFGEGPTENNKFYHIGTQVIGAISQGLTDAKDGLVSVLKSIAEAIYSVFADGVNYLINDVLNGLIIAYDAVAKFLHLPGSLQITDRIPDIPSKIPGMATGGIYPGYTPGKDIGYIGISGGEAVMRPEWTKAVGPEYVAAANKAAVNGGEAGVARFMGGFSLGGIIGKVYHGIKDIFSLPEKAAEALLSPVKGEINKIPDAGLLTNVLKGAAEGLIPQVIKSVIGLIGKANSGGNGWDYPLKGALRINKPFGGPDGHAGVDLYAKAGTPVYAAHAGTIDNAEPGGLAGNYMLVKADGTPYWYDMEHLTNWSGHHKGDKVSLGEQIAVSGYTGNVHPAGPGGAHLHFGIAKAQTIGSYGNIGNMLDPVSFLAAQGARPAGTAGGGANDGSALPGYKPKAGVAQWAPEIKTVLGMLKLPLTDTSLVEYQMNSESGGNPRAVNKWDINWQEGHPSVGLMQVIHDTFQTYAGPYKNVGGEQLYGVPIDPMANIYAGLNYALSTYGSGLFPRPGHGYDQGGWLQHNTTGYNLSGKPEAVLTNTQSTAYVELGELAPQLLAQLQRLAPTSGGQLNHVGPVSGDRVVQFNQVNNASQVTDVQALSRELTRQTTVALQGSGL